MAERRMFAKTIIDSDAFLEMPQSTQLLYFHLSMRADDDGFINKPKTIMKMTGAKDDDMKILISKKFIIPFESGIVVIKHWKIHNYIQNDRYTETKYKDEKSLLVFDENKSYKLLDNGSIMDPQVRLGKVSLNKKDPLFENSNEVKLSKLLFEKMKNNNPKCKKPNFQSWAKHIDLLIRIDKQTIDDIEKVIIWCQQDNFWSTNILSTAKLRQKFDQLFIKLKQKDNKKLDYDPYPEFKD